MSWLVIKTSSHYTLHGAFPHWKELTYGIHQPIIDFQCINCEIFYDIKQTMFQRNDIRFQQLLDITTWKLFSTQQFSSWLSVLYKVCNSMLFSYVNNTVLYLKIYMIQIMEQRFEGSGIHLYHYIAITMPVFNVTPAKYMA